MLNPVKIVQFSCESRQKGVITIPKSTKAHRLKENADIFDFALSDEDMKRLSDLNENKRIGPDPDNFDF